MDFQPLQVLAGLLTQSILYGLYIPTSVNCLRWLMFRDEGWKLQPRKNMRWTFIIITILLFGISTADLGISFRLMRARLDRQTEIASRLGFLAVAMEGFTLIMVDAVLIFRCWTVYNKSWRIVILPLVFWVSTIACALVWTICNAIGLNLTNNPTAIAIGVGVFFSCNFGTNVYATFAIVYRVWNVAISINRHSRLYQISRTVLGTGVLYSLTSFISLVTAFWAIHDSFPLSLASVTNFSTACIMYNLVIIRGSQLRAATEDVIDYNSTRSPTVTSIN